MLVDIQAQECAQLIQEARSIAALTGAGISTNAGIPDFRGPKGLYVTKRYDPDKVFDIDYFQVDPKPFFDFARDFISFENQLAPTIAHDFLAKLEAGGKLSGVITQNIDSLHQRAGSKKVFEMHGSFLKNFCFRCRKEFFYDEIKARLQNEPVPHCSCGGVIKPDVIFFGENVKYLAESSRLAEEVDLFFVIGTSCVVYPAAMLPTMVKGDIVIVNHDPIHLESSQVALSIQHDIDRFFQILDDAMGKG